MKKLTNILCALVLLLGIPAISMATCYSNNCGGCGGDGYYGCTTADITQVGYFNDANITQHGGGYSSNLAEIDQKGIGNKASIYQGTLAKFNEAKIYQEGWGNKADIEQYGWKNDAFINQDGAFNKANIDQYTSFNLANINQNGCGNNASITQGSMGWFGGYTANVYQAGGMNSAVVTQK